MNEHEMCCGTVADKAKLCAEIEQRDLRIKNLELCEEARARVAGRTLKFAMERGYNPASEEDELEYIMRRFDEMADQVERLREQIKPAVRLMRATGECSGWHEKAERLEKMLSEPSPSALVALNAEAVREAFIRGYFYARQYGFQFEEDLEAAADRYIRHIAQRTQEANHAPNT